MNFFAKTLAIVRTNSFLRHNLIFFIGSMVVAFLNYLYYPVMGRLLSNASFGEVQVIVSSFMQLSTILGVVSLIAIGIYVNEPDKNIARATVAQFEKVMLLCGLAVLVVIIASAGSLQHALKFSSVYPFIAIGFVFVVTIPLTFRNAQLRAVQDFNGASQVGALGSIVKLLSSVVFVLLSLYVFGAVLGIFVSQVAALTYAAWRLRKKGYEKYISSKRFDVSLVKPQLPYAGFVLAVSLLTTLQISIDVTIVKFYFSPSDAGNYAAIATIARIIFFLTGSIVAVLLSSVGRTKTDSENKHILKRSLGLVTILGGGVAVFFALFPSFVIHVLLGGRYDAYAHMLPLLSATLFLGSLVTLLTTYHIALHSYRVLPIVVAGSVLTFSLMALHHGTLDSVITNLLAGNALMGIGIAGYTFIRRPTIVR